MTLGSIRLSRFALSLILVSAVVALHFSGEPYRYDETWLVSAAQAPNLTSPLIRVWVAAFGTSPIVTRWLSALLLIMGLSIAARLSAIFADSGSAGLTFVLGGAFALWIDFSGRADLFALTFASGAALCGLFWLWMRQQRRAYAVTYLIGTLVMGLTYPSGLWLVALQLVFALVFSRPRNLRIWILPCVALVVGLLAALIIGWQGDTLAQAIDRALVQFDPPMRLLSADNLQILLLMGLGAAGLAVDWKPNGQAVRYFALMIGGLLAINVLGYAGTYQANMLALVLPLLIILAARGLLLLAQPLRVVLIALYVVLAVILIPLQRMTMPPYETLVKQISPDAGIAIAAPTAWQQAANLFYIRQHMPTASPFHLVDPSQRDDMRFLPISELNVASVSDINTQSFNMWAQTYTNIWMVEDGRITLDPAYLNEALKPFTAYTVSNWSGDRATEADTRRVVHYVRIPLDLQDLFHFGDVLVLRKWTLANDVNVRACQAITVQSWWQIQHKAQANYSLSLTLANTADGQGVTQSDSALGANETLLWQTDQPYFDERTLTIPCDLASGDYPLLYSVYHSQDNALQYLAASLPDGSPLGNQIYLTTLYVQGAP